MARYVKKTPEQWERERRRREEVRQIEKEALKRTQTANKEKAREARKATEEAAKAAKAATEAAERAAKARKATEEAEKSRKIAEEAAEAPKLSKNGGYFPEEYNDYVDEMYADQVKEFQSKPEEWQFDGFYWKPVGKNPLAKKEK